MFAKATYQFRRWYNFVEDEIQLQNGIVNVNQNGANIGNLTKVIYDNTNGIDREYQAIVLQSGYRFRSDLTFGANWTVQLENNGNANGEAANQPGTVSVSATIRRSSAQRSTGTCPRVVWPITSEASCVCTARIR